MFRLKKAHRRRLESFLFLVTPFLYPFLCLLRILPFETLALLAKVLASFWWILPSRRKRIARINLQLLYGPEESRRILKSAMENLIRYIVEATKFSAASKEEMLKRVRLLGGGHLKGLQGKGAILVSCHLGNFPLLCFRLSAEGWRVGAVLKYPKDPFISKVIDDRARRWGLTLIDGSSRREASLRALRFLREGGLLLVMLDQNPRSEGILAPFFGIPTPTYRSPLVLSKRTGARLLPAFTFSEGPGRHRVEILPPFEPSGDPAADLAALNGIIEQYVRRLPEQWWWWHRRWRHIMPYP